MDATSSRIALTGSWSISIGAEFEVVRNGDSVQAVSGERVIYVSSLQVGAPGQPVPGNQLRAVTSRRLGAGERISHAVGPCQGDATVSRVGDKWRLEGAMCADGTVATCVIDFRADEDRAWAESTWQSLHCQPQVRVSRDVRQTKDAPSCPKCGFRVFNRRYPKCERCGAALPESIVYSAEELAALRERERKEELERQRERSAEKWRTPAQGALGEWIVDAGMLGGHFSADAGDGGGGGDGDA